MLLDGIKRAVRRAMADTAKTLERQIKIEAPKDRHALERSIRIIRGRRPEQNGVEITMLFYGKFQSEGFGGKGKYPPVDALMGWVRRKLGITNPAEVRSVAFLVARKLALVGGPGRRAKRPNRFVERAILVAGVELRREFRMRVEQLRLTAPAARLTTGRAAAGAN